MSKAVSTREAQNRLSSLIGWVNEHNDAVIVEKRGVPTAVLIPYAEYESLQAAKEQQRRQRLLTAMRELQARVSARSTDLSEVEAEALADEVTDAAVASLVARGVLSVLSDDQPLLRVLVDTNIFISYLLTPTGASGTVSRLVEAAVLAEFTLLLPEELLAELDDTLRTSRKLSRRITTDEGHRLVELLRQVVVVLPMIAEPIPRSSAIAKTTILSPRRSWVARTP